MVSNQALKRAQHPAQKAQRRTQILEAAGGLILESGYAQVSMADIAVASGVAKGTLYLYFPTREALFLALITEEFAACFDTLDGQLARLSAPATAVAAAAAVRRAVAGRPLLLALVGLLHTVLEHNVDADAARRFKMLLRDRALTSGARLETLLPAFAPGDGARLLLTAHVLTVGWRHAAEPAPVIRQLLAEPELALFRADFSDNFEHTLAAVIRGWPTQGREQ